MQSNRRFFLKNGALALAGTAALPGFLVRALQAEGLSQPAQRLVVVFQRGAVDGLNVVVPWREKNYYKMRPTISVAADQVLDLDGFFGLHPSLASFKSLYDQRHLAVIHAAGSPDATRSHFDAQDFMESGTPGVKSTTDGWLNRALVAEDQRKLASHTAFRAVALGGQLPRTLAGTIPALALSNLRDFAVGGNNRNPAATPAANALEAMYGASYDSLLQTTGAESFEAVKMLREANPEQYQPAANVHYPENEFGRNMRQIAQLFKCNLGVETAFTDMGGWDTHQNQGGATGQLADRLREFAESINAFWQDLGDAAENVTLVTMSEFGRTARQNGTGGTDHGHANVMFVLGGKVIGGKVYGRWPGLNDEQLNEGRDLAVTTDFRAVLGEILQKKFALAKLDGVFPGAPLKRESFLGLL